MRRRTTATMAEKVEFAQWMRDHPTTSEAHVWKTLGTMRYMRWVRQEILWGWIVDFYCPEWRIVLEIDGPYHRTAEVRASDAERDRVLREKGFTVFRVEAALAFEEQWWDTVVEFLHSTPELRAKIGQAITEAEQCPAYAR